MKKKKCNKKNKSNKEYIISQIVINKLKILRRQNKK